MRGRVHVLGARLRCDDDSRNSRLVTDRVEQLVPGMDDGPRLRGIGWLRVDRCPIETVQRVVPAWPARIELRRRNGPHDQGRDVSDRHAGVVRDRHRDRAFVRSADPYPH
jgi:hypothetical protein